jgi:hypothetical protein
MFINEIPGTSLLRNRFKTNKNLGEKPDLPIDFKNLYSKPKV